jgi:aryl-alcohol dehydrogenase-like predicted oxidoreductase
LKNNKLILGTVQLGLNYGINNRLGKPSEQDSLAILDFAYSAGIKMVDTADAYGNSPDLIGKYHRQSSNRFDVIQKFAMQGEFEYGKLEKSFHNSLKQLGVEYLYCYMFHKFSDMKSASALNDLLYNLKEKAFLRHIGVSIYTPEELNDSIEEERIDLIQTPFNLLDNESQRGNLLTAGKAKNKIIHARSVFLQGLFFMDTEKIPVKLQPLEKYLRRIRQILADFNEEALSAALNYVLTDQRIDGVIFGVDNISHLKKNLDVVKNDFNMELVKKIGEIKVNETDLLNPANWN